jgi:hypothetical protein
VKKFLIPLLLFAFFLLPSHTHAADMYLILNKTQVAEQGTFTGTVYVSTGGLPINNGEGTIHFPSDLISVDSVSTAGSIFNIWVEQPSFSNTAGTIYFNGGLPTPGYAGESGTSLRINFRAKKAGAATLTFGSSAIRANDGIGTDVIAQKRGASITITPPVQTPPQPTAPSAPTVKEPTQTASKAPEITSKTHPDQTKWYTANDANFLWELPAGAKAVRMELDTKAFTIPTFSYPLSSYKELSSVDEGVSYFHLRIQTNNTWGETAHYKIQVDTTKPTSFEAREVPRSDPTINTLRFTLEAEDAVSGIDHYEISIDGKKPEILSASQTNTYETKPLSTGRHTFYAKAVDRAGNYLEKKLEFTIEQPVVFTIGKWAFSIFAILIPLLIIIFLMATLCVYLYFRFIAFRRRMRKEAEEAEDVIDKSFTILKEDAKRGVSSKTFTQELTDAEKVIKKEIKDIEKGVGSKKKQKDS